MVRYVFRTLLNHSLIYPFPLRARGIGAKYTKYILDQPVRPLYISKTAEVYACKIIVEKKIKKEKDDEKGNQEKEQKKMMIWRVIQICAKLRRILRDWIVL